MVCKHCLVDMVLGYAIEPNLPEGCLSIAPVGNYDWEQLKTKFIEVWKCPLCGHSEHIE